MEASNGRARNSFDLWRRKLQEHKRVKEIQKRFLAKLLMSKAGRVAEAFRIIKNLPGLVDMERRRRASKFEKGLSSFLERTIRRSYNAYKN